MHTHERPYLIISATPLVLKMTDPEGKSFTHEVKAGDIHWVEANSTDAKVTHTLANEGPPKADRRNRIEIVSISSALFGESHSLLSLSAMPRTLDPELRRALAARIRYYNEMGIYDFYRRPREPAADSCGGWLQQCSRGRQNPARIGRRDESTQGRGGAAPLPSKRIFLR